MQQTVTAAAVLTTLVASFGIGSPGLRGASADRVADVSPLFHASELSAPEVRFHGRETVRPELFASDAQDGRGAMQSSQPDISVEIGEPIISMPPECSTLGGGPEAYENCSVGSFSPLVHCSTVILSGAWGAGGRCSALGTAESLGFCSAVDSGSFNNCSVLLSGVLAVFCSTDYQECSAIGDGHCSVYPGAIGSCSTGINGGECSAFFAGAACSVAQGQTGASCTSFGGSGSCSAFAGATACSAIGPGGEVTPPSSNLSSCGGF